MHSQYRAAVTITGLFGAVRPRSGALDISVVVPLAGGHEFFMFASLRDKEESALHFQSGNPVRVKGVLVPNRNGPGYVVLADSIEPLRDGGTECAVGDDLFNSLPEFPSEEEFPTSFFYGENNDDEIESLKAEFINPLGEYSAEGGETHQGRIRETEGFGPRECGIAPGVDTDFGSEEGHEGEGTGLASDGVDPVRADLEDRGPSEPLHSWRDPPRDVSHGHSVDSRQDADPSGKADGLCRGLRADVSEGALCESREVPKEFSRFALENDPELRDPLSVMNSHTWITTPPPTLRSTRTEYIDGKRYRCTVFNPYDPRMSALLIGEARSEENASGKTEVIRVEGGPTVYIEE